MSRPNKDEYFLQMVKLVASRSTCIRRNVGCIMTNKRGHVVATGYNGVASGQPHCIDKEHRCTGAGLPSGQGLDQCQAIHAEQNALLQCKDVYEIETCYVTVSPCITCTKLLMGTSCRRIIFLEEYVHTEAKELWLSSNHDNTRPRYWEKHYI